MRKRYTSIAISLHWLIAILLVGLIAVGKYMNELEESDHLRFELIQWHKSFGILVLLLIVLRIIWRLTHRPPQLSSSLPSWQRFAASATHLILYLLVLVIPLSGWVMVSVSPLNLATELFGVIPWPHLSVDAATGFGVSDRETVSELSITAHHYLANGLLILVLLHIGAALRHQFVLKDNLMSRMWVADEHRRNLDLNHAIIPGVLLAAAIGLFLWEKAATEANEGALNVNQVSGTAIVDTVGFTAIQMGSPINGVFETVSIDLVINDESPSLSSLSATLQTASVNTGNGQIDGTVVTANWFASDQYPVAEFRSTSVEPVTGTSDFLVLGELTIRNNSRKVSFKLLVEGDKASGEFLINRGDYAVGTGGQDEFIEPEVTIRFETTAK